jgi:hypothetical protein
VWRDSGGLKDVSYNEEFTKASIEILNKATAELNGLEKRLTDSVEQPGRPVQELTPILERLAEAALLCEKTITFYSNESAFPIAINRAVCRVQRAIAGCLNALSFLRVIPALAARTNSKRPGASEPS